LGIGNSTRRKRLREKQEQRQSGVEATEIGDGAIDQVGDWGVVAEAAADGDGFAGGGKELGGCFLDGVFGKAGEKDGGAGHDKGPRRCEAYGGGAGDEGDFAVAVEWILSRDIVGIVL